VRILARVNLSLPWHGAGAELYLHSLLRELVRRGHECTVAARGAPHPALLDGVVYAPPLRSNGTPRDCDLVLTHLDDTQAGRDLARKLGVPLAVILHNHRQPFIYGHRPGDTALAVWNSQWTRDAAYLEQLDWLPFADAELVAPPPVEPADYVLTELTRTGPGLVTLVNLQPEKGVHQAIELARRLPRQGFLFVVGAYGRQVRPRLANVQVIPPVAWDRMREAVYARTRVLLMPSEYESYGRCGVEAAHAGVPTIAHPTGGLVEALGAAGIYAHRDRVDEWLRVLECLADPDSYANHSDAARARAAELDPQPVYDKLEAALEAACK
jgi:glycosyltransferase involved in cell wall biosynthesis